MDGNQLVQQVHDAIQSFQIAVHQTGEGKIVQSSGSPSGQGWRLGGGGPREEIPLAVVFQSFRPRLGGDGQKPDRPPRFRMEPVEAYGFSVSGQR